MNTTNFLTYFLIWPCLLFTWVDCARAAKIENLTIEISIDGLATSDPWIEKDGDRVTLHYKHNKTKSVSVTNPALLKALVPYLNSGTQNLWIQTYPALNGPAVVRKFNNHLQFDLTLSGAINSVQAPFTVASGFGFGQVDQMRYKTNEGPKSRSFNIEEVFPISKPITTLPVSLWQNGQESGVGWLSPIHNEPDHSVLEYRWPGQGVQTAPSQVIVGTEGFGNIRQMFKDGHTNLQFHLEGLQKPAEISIFFGSGAMARVYPSPEEVKIKKQLLEGLFSPNQNYVDKIVRELKNIPLAMTDYITILEKWRSQTDLPQSEEKRLVAENIIRFISPYLRSLERNDTGWGAMMHRLNLLMQRDPVFAARLIHIMDGIHDSKAQLREAFESENLFKPPQGPVEELRLLLKGGMIEPGDKRLQKVATMMHTSPEQLRHMAGTHQTTESHLSEFLVYGAQLQSGPFPDANPATARILDQEARVAAAYLLSFFPQFAHPETRELLTDSDLLTTLILAKKSTNPDVAAMAELAIHNIKAPEDDLLEASQKAKHIPRCEFKNFSSPESSK